MQVADISSWDFFYDFIVFPDVAEQKVVFHALILHPKIRQVSIVRIPVKQIDICFLNHLDLYIWEKLENPQKSSIFMKPSALRRCSSNVK